MFPQLYVMGANHTQKWDKFRYFQFQKICFLRNLKTEHDIFGKKKLLALILAHILANRVLWFSNFIRILP